MIAALYVKTGGSYFGIEGVDPWDEARDARKYDGPHPVVAHPPCQRCGRFWAGQPLHIAKTGERKIKGDDGGCFAHAIAAVRQFGGVLEHPEGSHAWAHFGLQKPPRHGGWIIADDYGWTCCVEQGRYGHYARKPTWLYAVGCKLPELDWGKSEPIFPPEAIAKYGLAYCKRAGELRFKGGGKDSVPRIGTAVAFRDILIAMARSASCQTQSPSLSAQAKAGDESVKTYDNDLIEKIARAYCVNLGLDPDECVQADYDRFMLVGEFKGGCVCDIPGNRWELYRAKVQKELAMRDAIAEVSK